MLGQPLQLLLQPRRLSSSSSQSSHGLGHDGDLGGHGHVALLLVLVEPERGVRDAGAHFSGTRAILYPGTVPAAVLLYCTGSTRVRVPG